MRFDIFRLMLAACLFAALSPTRGLPQGLGVFRNIPIIALSDEQLVIRPSTFQPIRAFAEMLGVPLASYALHYRGLEFRPECELPTTEVAIDDISFGNDWLTMGPRGDLQIPAGAFSGMLYHVSYHQNSADAAEQPRGLTGYIFPGSNAPPALVGHPFVAYYGNELQRPTPGHRISALELMDSSNGVSYAHPGRLLGNAPTLYLSVRGGSVYDTPASWWQQADQPRRPSGAHILSTQWDAATARWSCPRIFTTAEDLGLTADDDIDALSFDRDAGNFMFSTVGDRDGPLLFQHVRFGLGTASAIMRSNDHPVRFDAPIAPELDLGNAGDIDSACGWDP